MVPVLRLQIEEEQAPFFVFCDSLRLMWPLDMATQQRRSMVPAPRLQIKDAQGEERDVLQGLLSLQDAEVALPLDPSGAPCRLSR